MAACCAGPCQWQARAGAAGASTACRGTESGRQRAVRRINHLLREHHVHVVMAGIPTTSSIPAASYRRWRPGRSTTSSTAAAAHIKLRTALAWPAQPPTAVWAFYPTRNDVASKNQSMDAALETSGMVVDQELGAWPFSAEWLSAAFDYNVAPFFQSFIEVRVEPGGGRPGSALGCARSGCAGRTCRCHRE